MKNSIPALCPNDKIVICAPAKAIEPEHVLFARDLFEEAGYRVEISAHCLDRDHYFSGSIETRQADFQQALDDPEVRAIVCARGGYGCVQLTDRLQWAGFLREPKWITGFSDVTFFHQHIQRFGLPSIHASMPLNFRENTPETFNTLFSAWSAEPYSISFDAHPDNKPGKASGILLGGNLSVLFSLIGTDDQPDYQDAILFFEDLAEYLYHVDRMLYAFEKSDILQKISGVVIGGMTDMRDTTVPFGQNLESLILSHLQFRQIPVAFGFPAGHIADNRALRLGSPVELEVGENCVLRFC